MDKSIHSDSYQLKNNLIAFIQNSNDLNFLNALETIFESKNKNFKLSSEQIEAISLSRTEISNGEHIENSRMLTDIKSWLKK